MQPDLSVQGAQVFSPPPAVSPLYFARVQVPLLQAGICLQVPQEPPPTHGIHPSGKSPKLSKPLFTGLIFFQNSGQ